MSVLIRNFRLGDLGKIETTRPADIDRDSAYYPRMEELGRTMVELPEERPIAAWGMQPHWPGVASVWSDFSQIALTKYAITTAKNVKRHLEEHIVKLDLHRVQSIILSGDEVSIHWIKWLGFHLEGEMKQYMKGIDALLFARLIH